MGNNSLVDVLGIGTCKLVIQRDHTLYIHDVLYASKVRRNLVSVVILLQLGFKIVFEKDCVKYCWTTFFTGLALC